MKYAHLFILMFFPFVSLFAQYYTPDLPHPDTLEVELDDEEIAAYVDSGEPHDKAGAYGIQGGFAKYIKEISGDYFNVVGLPVSRLYHELKEILK